MTSTRFMLLYYDVKKCIVVHTLDFHIHIETAFEIIGLPVLNLVSSFSSFVYNNPRSNSGVQQYEGVQPVLSNSGRNTCEAVQFLVKLQACCKVTKVGSALNSFVSFFVLFLFYIYIYMIKFIKHLNLWLQKNCYIKVSPTDV